MKYLVAQYLYEMKQLNLKLDTHIIIPIKIICIFCSKFMFSATHKVRSKTVSLVIYCFSYFYHQINFRSALICILFKINKWDKDKWLMDFFIHNVRLYYSFFLSPLLCLICKQVAMNIYTRYLCYVFLLIVKRCWVKNNQLRYA